MARHLLVVLGVVALLLGMSPVSPASAAGNGVLSVTVRITDQNGTQIDVVDASKIGAYRVQILYSCNVAQCDNAQVSLAAMPADPYYGTNHKEQSYTFTPPSGITPTPAASGSIASGFTVPLGNLASGSGGSMSFDFNVGTRRAGPIAGNFFPDGSPISPQVTLTSSSAPAVSGSASAVWKSYIPTPTLNVRTGQSNINTDTTLTVTADLTSGCFVGASYPYNLCGETAQVTVDLPSNAHYVAGSGGTYDAGTGTVTLKAGPRAWASGAPTFQVRFPSSSMPTTSPGCVATQTFTARDATYTYLDGSVRSTSPTTSTATVTVGNCAPFAKGSVRKTATVRGAPTEQVNFSIPATAAGTYDMNWIVIANNQANVPAVATIVDDALDVPDLPVTQIQTLDGSPASSIQYTLKDDTTGTLTTGSVSGQGSYQAPAGTHITAATVTSPVLAAPNVQQTDTGSTPFGVRYIATVRTGATPGPRTNTASATFTYPDNPGLGTYTPPSSPASYELNLVTAANPFTLSSNGLTATAPGGSTPIVGTQVTWAGNGTAYNLTASTNWTPQYVFLAPLGWTIDRNSASLSTPVAGMASPVYKTVTYDGQSYEAVVLTWPGPVDATDTHTLPTLSVKTQPTGAAIAGTNNQTAYLFVGDADNALADAYAHGSGYVDGTDIDDDGSTTDRFDRSSGTASLGVSPALDVKKFICRPDASASDGCEWISDPSVTVGVPPSATSIKYRVTIKNTGNAPLSSVAAYDVLPYIGDTGTGDAASSTPRGSTVQEQLSTVTNDSADVTLEYSASTNPPRPEVYSGSTTGTWDAPATGAAAIRATIASLAPGASRSFEYTAGLVGASADQTACNSVAAAGAGIKVEPSPVCATTQQADFSLDSTDHLPLQAGRMGVVPFVVNNGGGSASATGTVTIEVPAEVSLASLTQTGWDCTAASMRGPVELTCTPVNPDGSTRSLDKDEPETINLQVRPSAAAPGQVCFDASVTGLMNDPDPDNNTATSCSTAVAAQPELVVTKTDARTAVEIGETYTYTLTAFSRLVAESIDGVTVTDTLPDALEFVTANPAPTSRSGQELSWDLGILARAGVPAGGGDLATGGAGSSKTVTVTVRVRPGAQDSIANTAKATGTDPADASVIFSAQQTDTDTVTNVFTDLGAEESTPQNTPVMTPLAEIASSAGAPIDPTAVTQATAPAHGTVVIDAATGAVTYAPAAGYSGADSYGVRVCDTSSPERQCFVATVDVTVGANTVAAVDDTDATVAGVPVSTNVRTNDTSASGQPWAAPTVTVAPGHGTTTVGTGGVITYTPAAGFSGTDTYTYRACDTSNPTPACDTATVRIAVANVFTDLGAEVSTPQNTAVTTPLDEIVKVTGAPVDPSTVTTETAPAHGTLTVHPTTGAVTYTPSPGYSGADSYEVRVCDTSAPDRECFTASVQVTVAVNVVTAVDDAETIETGTSVTTNVRSNDATASGQALSAPTVRTQPDNGTVTVGNGGAITYTPDAGFSGTDSYGYEVCDTSSTPVCDAATVTVLVANVFTDLGARATTAHRTAVTTPLSDMVKVTGAKVDPAAVTEKTAPTHGTLSINPVTGAVTYHPTGGYSGADSYRLDVCDTSSPDPQCFAVTVAVSVGANAVTAVDDADTTSTGEPVTTQVRANDTSASGQPLAEPRMVPNARVPATLRQPSHGTAAPGTDGSITYTPSDGFAGVDSYTYQVCDTSNPTPVCDTATVTVTVTRLASDVDLVLRKSVVGQSRVTVGDRIRYRLRVSNEGADVATASLKLVDRLPKGLELVSARGQGWECKVRKASDTASCVRERDLGAGKASAVYVVAATTRAAIGRSVNVASVSVAGESARANNKDGAKVNVTPVPSLPGTGFRHNTGGL